MPILKPCYPHRAVQRLGRFVLQLLKNGGEPIAFYRFALRIDALDCLIQLQSLHGES